MINELTLTDVIETKNVETLRKKIIEVGDSSCFAWFFADVAGVCEWQENYRWDLWPNASGVSPGQPSWWKWFVLSRVRWIIRIAHLLGQQVQKRMEEEMWELLEEERKKEEAREKERVIQKVRERLNLNRIWLSNLVLSCSRLECHVRDLATRRAWSFEPRETRERTETARERTAGQGGAGKVLLFTIQQRTVCLECSWSSYFVLTASVKLANERAGRWAYPSTSHKVPLIANRKICRLFERFISFVGRYCDIQDCQSDPRKVRCAALTARYVLALIWWLQSHA